MRHSAFLQKPLQQENVCSHATNVHYLVTPCIESSFDIICTCFLHFLAGKPGFLPAGRGSTFAGNGACVRKSYTQSSGRTKRGTIKAARARGCRNLSAVFLSFSTGLRRFWDRIRASRPFVDDVAAEGDTLCLCGTHIRARCSQTVLCMNLIIRLSFSRLYIHRRSTSNRR